jgi:hypothetical protein
MMRQGKFPGGHLPNPLKIKEIEYTVHHPSSQESQSLGQFPGPNGVSTGASTGATEGWAVGTSSDGGESIGTDSTGE